MFLLFCQFFLTHQVITIADLVIIVFVAGLTGHYVFVLIFVGFVSTFGVLKTTSKATKKAGKKPKKKEKVPKEGTSTLVIENEMEVVSRKEGNAEESLTVDIQSAKVGEIEDTQEEKPTEKVEEGSEEESENGKSRGGEKSKDGEESKDGEATKGDKGSKGDKESEGDEESVR